MRVYLEVASDVARTEIFGYEDSIINCLEVELLTSMNVTATLVLAGTQQSLWNS